MARTLKNLLDTIIRPEKNWKMNLLYKWEEIIGSLCNKVRIEKIYENTIILGVFHSCWMQELYLLSPLLIQTTNEKLDQPYIKEVRFKYIGIKKTKKEEKQAKRIPKKNLQLTKQDELILAKIADPALREALKAFRIRCYQE